MTRLSDFVSVMLLAGTPVCFVPSALAQPAGEGATEASSATQPSRVEHDSSRGDGAAVLDAAVTGNQVSSSYVVNNVRLTDREGGQLQIDMGFGIDFPYDVVELYAQGEYMLPGLLMASARPAVGMNLDLGVTVGLELLAGYPVLLGQDKEEDFVTLAESHDRIAGSLKSEYLVQPVEVNSRTYIIPMAGVRTYFGSSVKARTGSSLFPMVLLGARYNSRWDAHALMLDGSAEQHLWGNSHVDGYAKLMPKGGGGMGWGLGAEYGRMTKLGGFRATWIAGLGFNTGFYGRDGKSALDLRCAIHMTF